MKRKRRFKNGIIALILLFSMFVPNFGTENMQAASSYTNAMMFYESVMSNKKCAVETVNGTIYYATKAKLASSSTNTKYHTLGFDITLAGNGSSVSFSVARNGGSMVEISNIQYGGYDYILYAIKDQTLFALASSSNSTATTKVLGASYIRVDMNAIMTTKQGGVLNGGISENGSGGLYEWGNIYHLKNYTHLVKMKSIFSGHTFDSYINIWDVLENYKLSIRYNLQGTDVANVNCTSTATAGGNGYSVTGGILYKDGSQYIQTSRVLQAVNLINPGTINLTKTGYHLDAGREWTALSRVYSATQSYMPKEIYSGVGYQDVKLTLYANWQRNNYTIEYMSNGGNGYVFPSKMEYDREYTIRSNTFFRDGYHLVKGKEWNTKSDGTGISYSSEQVVKNLTTKNNVTIKLYANWEPNTYEITTDQAGGTGGADVFYEKYEHGWYSDEKTTNKILSITIPVKIGYDFLGYFPYTNGVGEMVVDNTGKIVVKSDFFLQNARVYAAYKPKNYNITFEKMGGTGGTDTAVAIYDEYLPYDVEAPLKKGYSFKGYYGDDTYTGEPYYIETMAPNIRYTFDHDITIYAKWVDDIEPRLGISVSTSNWTNGALGVDVKAYAYDLGSGLDKVELYCGNTLVAEQTNLNGTKETIKLSYIHTTEGAYQYKVVSYDMDGNVSEKYATVKYDIKPPTGTFTVTNPDLKDLGVDVHANDYNIQ